MSYTVCNYNGCDPFPFTPYWPFIMIGATLIIAASCLQLLVKFKKISEPRAAAYWNTFVLSALAASLICSSRSIRSFNRLIPPSWDTAVQYKARFGDVYIFAQKALALLPGGCQAAYVSDIPQGSPLGLGTRDHIKYFIYPINIPVNEEPVPANCLVAFQKKAPEQSVPPGYRILLRYKSDCLLAVKQ